MTKNERQDRIMAILEKDKYSTPDYLASQLLVSAVTVRRDLKKLEQDGLVNTCYGGVSISNQNNWDIPLVIRENFNDDIKTNLAKKAAKLIANDSTVFLDASSTVSRIANFLKPEQNVTVITNGIKALTLLSQRHIKSYCIGGRLVDNSLAFVGAVALKTIAGMHADYMFFSSQGLTLDGNITDFSEAETELRQAMLSHAGERYFLCDSSKIGRTCLFRVCHAEDLNGIFCDQPLNFSKQTADSPQSDRNPLFT